MGRARSAPSVLFPESRTSVPLDSCCTAGPPRWSPGASQGAQSAFLANWGLLAILCRLWSMPLVRFSFNFGPRLGHSTSPCVFLCVSELCPNSFGLSHSHVSYKRRSFGPCGLSSSLSRSLRLLSFLSASLALLARCLCSPCSPAGCRCGCCFLPLSFLLACCAPLALSFSLSLSLPFARSRRLAREGTTDHRCARVRYGSRKTKGGN